jgi:TRAP-type C4-dicarboxylate transport system permease small subunit
MSAKFNSFEKAVVSIAKWLNWIAAATLVLMVALVVVDIIAIKGPQLILGIADLLHIQGITMGPTPIPGSIEIVSLLSVIAITFAIAQTQIQHGHIEVEMLVTKLPKTAQKVIASVEDCFSILLFALLCWKSMDYGYALWKSGEVSMTLQVPYYLFVYGIAFSSLVVALVLIVQMIKAIRETA